MIKENFPPSLLRGLHTNYSILTSWEEMYRIITQERWVADQTQLYRTTHDEKYKHLLPAVTTAVQLDGKGKAVENIVGYTDVTHCDLDHVPTERLAEIMERIKSDPHTLLCNVSPSGNGIHIYARYIPVTDSTDYKDCYHDAFMTVNCYYADLLALPFDEQCSNPNKTLSLSHDPEAYYNPSSTSFKAASLRTADIVSDTYYPGTPALSAAQPSPASPVNKKESPDGTMQDETDMLSTMQDQMDTPSTLHKTEESPDGTALVDNPVQAKRSAGCNAPTVDHAARRDAHLRWVKEYTDPIEFAEKYVREKQSITYTEGHSNEYLYKCLNMMNLLGVDRTAAEHWLRDFDLPSREKQSILKSGYKRTNEFGKFDRPYTWKEEVVSETKTKTKTKTKTNASLSLCHNVTGHPHTHARAKLPQFPEYQWPRFIQQMIECADTKPQRDVLLIAVITVLGGMLGRTVKFNYSKRFWHPALQTFVIAPPASGKSVISWARRLCDALTRMLEDEYNEKRKAYDKEKAEYDVAGKERANMAVPVPPKMNLFQIAGNNSSSGIMENLDECDGWGLICESEADTLSAAINADYGNWGDILRKAFDHDLMIMFRRTNKERRKIENPCLSVLISGTPAQVKPLIVSAENGQFSREIFLQLPAINDFIDQFDEESVDMDSRFGSWGKEWLEVWKALQAETHCIELHLSAGQRETFNEHFSSLFHHANYTQPTHHMKSSVAREAINILRIMCVVAFFRAIEAIRDLKGDLRNLLDEAEDRSRKDEDGCYQTTKVIHLLKSDLFRLPKDVAADNVKDGIHPRYELLVTDEDFNAVLALAEPIYRYACDVLNLLPSTEAVRNQVSAANALLNGLPLEFNCEEAIAIGKELGLTESHVRNLLSELTSDKKLVKPGRGKYELAFPSSVTSRACV